MTSQGKQEILCETWFKFLYSCVNILLQVHQSLCPCSTTEAKHLPVSSAESFSFMVKYKQMLSAAWYLAFLFCFLLGLMPFRQYFSYIVPGIMLARCPWLWSCHNDHYFAGKWPLPNLKQKWKGFLSKQSITTQARDQTHSLGGLALYQVSY